MGFINVAERTINAKLVYYGVGVGGKTTSLQQVHGILCPRNEVQLVSINTEEDSTLLFDFLPINLGEVGGFKIKIQGFTVPGQPKYRQMRKYVLQGADAVVFVVDSQRCRLQENVESLQSLRENLRAASGTSEDIPIVVQYNKRDLPDVLGEAELDRAFRFRPDIAAFPTVATEGQGVFEAFVEAASLLVARKVERYGLDCAAQDLPRVVDGVRSKLWTIGDEIRRAREVVAPADQPKLRVALADAPPTDDDAPLQVLSDQRFARLDPAADTVDASDGPSSLVGGLAANEPIQVLSDADLAIELAPASALSAPSEPVVLHDVDPQLLDQTVQSNIELVRRFGELDEQRLLLEHKVEELVDASQQTAHDLNRPLTALRLMMSGMDKGTFGQLGEPIRKVVQTGLQAVRQMERLVRDLIDSSRLDHDGVRLEFVDCDLGAVVGEVLQLLRFEIAERRAQVCVDPLPVVRADPWALNKVFTNLLGNALNYAKPGQTPSVHIRAEGAGASWHILVADAGIGIPVGDRSRLFRRFERGSNAGGVGGTGLGLHIVRQLVHGHGGEITFDSAVGIGTTFKIELPKAPVRAPHSPTSSVVEARDR
jgi:signal transduction histidine kinase/signal recognition particle receptor subunit beta